MPISLTIDTRNYEQYLIRLSENYLAGNDPFFLKKANGIENPLVVSFTHPKQFYNLQPNLKYSFVLQSVPIPVPKINTFSVNSVYAAFDFRVDEAGEPTFTCTAAKITY